MYYTTFSLSLLSANPPRPTAHLGFNLLQSPHCLTLSDVSTHHQCYLQRIGWRTSRRLFKEEIRFRIEVFKNTEIIFSSQLLKLELNTCPASQPRISRTVFRSETVDSPARPSVTAVESCCSSTLLRC